jgi:hypothetical protein
MALSARVHEDRSLVRLFKDLSTETVTLLRQEIDLAKTELKEKVADIATMSRTAAIGGGLAFAGGLALLAAVILAVTSLFSRFMSLWVSMWVAPLVVGITLAALGYMMIRSTLDTHRQSLVPHRTAESLQENKEWLKSKIQ